MKNLITSAKHQEELTARQNLKVKSLNASYDEILQAIENCDASVVFQDREKGLIVALIDNYDASLHIGSENWCISSVRYGGMTPGEYYWNWYVGNPSRRQYFVWNLNHPNFDYKLVGTTTNEDLKNFYCAYNFPNQAFNMEKYINSVDGLEVNMFFNNDALRKNPSNINNKANDFNSIDESELDELEENL